MNETVYVEFLIEQKMFAEVYSTLLGLGADFTFSNIEVEYDFDNTGYTSHVYRRITGKITSSAASILKLSDGYLSERMVISYISDDLKNKYRK